MGSPENQVKVENGKSTNRALYERPPRPRRRVPLSLRMFVAMLLLAGIGGPLWIGVRAWRQDRLVRQLAQEGLFSRRRFTGPNWLESRLPDLSRYFFSSVESVSTYHGSSRPTSRPLWRGRHISDPAFVLLAAMSDLEVLELDGSDINDAGLARLAGLTRLKRLSLNDTPVTDAGLAHLSRQTGLTSLRLSGTQVTDAGLTHLKSLTNLRWLELDDTQVTATGRNELRRTLPAAKSMREMQIERWK